ncbi:MAG: undecaprenyl-diphosphate phosphatase [Desulfobacteraceae bacterium]|nr:undecaprenyl-diphosphate phosphatase [Desulfobacteraceae bacterium]
MEIYQGIILGILQGLTEFLPVSSSGHLVLGQIYFKITQVGMIFDVSVHMGTLLAVLVVYFADIKLIFASVFRVAAKVAGRKPFVHLFKTDENLKLAVFIIVGSVPTALLGLVLKNFEDVLFTSKTLVGCMLILTGTILWSSRRYYNNEVSGGKLDTRRAIFIGIVQGFAVIPGISRSGSTIVAGMFAGLDRDRAAKFSFLLSVPAILGAQILSVNDVIKTGMTIDPAIIYGTITSFFIGLIALKLLLKLVHQGKFHLFAPYCWLVGVLVLLSKLI